MMRTILAALVWLALAVPSQAQFADQMTWGGTGGGTTNAQTVTIANVGALSDLLGVEVRFSPGATNTSATTLAASGLTATAMRKWSPAGLIALTGGELRSGVPVSVMYNGTFFVLLSPQVAQPTPTRQVLTGAGIYAPNTSNGQSPRWLNVRMIAGGGGGGAAGVGNGGNGGNTTFCGVTVTGGSGGIAATSSGGAGGTGGAGTAALRIAGGNGAGYSTTQNLILGGAGGNGAFGGAGAPSLNAVGSAAKANSGAGGAGGGDSATDAGPGGGAGEYAEFGIDPVSCSSFTAGTAGTAGSGSGNAGTAGGNGVILVEEVY